MEDDFKLYPLEQVIRVNGQRFTHCRIDQHYEKAHSEHVDDQLICSLMSCLDGLNFFVEAEDAKGKLICVVNLLGPEDKPYRMVINTVKEVR